MDEVRIVLLGKTGSGKSSAGNVILGEKKFEASSNSKSVTKHCQTEEGIINGRNITVIDTPGIFDPDLSEKDQKYSIISCLTGCAPGSHAFILLLRVGRYTKEEKESVKMILKWFGEEALKHTVVLFTCGDELEENQTIKDFVMKNEDLKKLVDKCDDRVHVIDSKRWNKKYADLDQGSGKPMNSGGHLDEYRSNSFQIKQLLITIDNMVRDNRGSHYTNKSLQVIAEDIDKEVNKIKEEMEEKGEKAEESVIWRRARKRVRNKIWRLMAGVTTGVLLGALLGGAIGILLPVILAAGLLVGEVASGCRNLVAGAVGAVGALDAGAAAGIGVGVAAGGLAAAGAIGGGVEGARAAARSDTPKEAAGNAAEAVVEKAGNVMKEAWEVGQRVTKTKETPYKKLQ